MPKTPVIAPPDVPVFIMTRTFSAPRTLVWKALTDPALFAQWWGPNGFTAKVHAMDVRPGGKWKVDSTAPDGQVATFWGEVVEVREQERIAQTFHFMDYPPNLDVMVIEDHGDGGTRMTSTTVMTSIEGRTGMLASGMEDGASQTYDRLEALLATL